MPLNRDEVSDIVVNLLRRLHQNEYLAEDSRFDFDIPIDENLKRLYYYAIRLEIERMGCILIDFEPEDCVKADSVRDIVDAIWIELKDDR